MYIIEKVLKLFYRKKHKKNNYAEREIDTCNHVFLPIDSTKEYLACTKCGKVIKNPKTFL